MYEYMNAYKYTNTSRIAVTCIISHCVGLIQSRRTFCGSFNHPALSLSVSTYCVGVPSKEPGKKLVYQ